MSLAAGDGGPDVDALLLLSFGGPEGPDDVVPFLERVTSGRGIPRARLAEVGRHYDHVGGVSPINGQNRALLAALREELHRRGWDLPVYWGNRNWHPFLVDTMREMASDGVGRALVWVTSAYPSYSGCRQYRENLWDAATQLREEGVEPPQVDRLRAFFDHPGFVLPMVDAVVAAVEALRERDWGKSGSPPRLVFTTHSIPLASAGTSGPPGLRFSPPGGAYVATHEAVCRLVAETAGQRLGATLEWDLVYQSRSGAPGVPWLEPDVGDHLAAVAAHGAEAVVIVPVGFVSDHMEVVWDLDVVAMEQAAACGLTAVRVATVGTDPRFVAMIADLVGERAGEGAGPGALREALTDLGPWHDDCPAGCCPNPRGPRPACGRFG